MVWLMKIKKIPFLLKTNQNLETRIYLKSLKSLNTEKTKQLTTLQKDTKTLKNNPFLRKVKLLKLKGR